MKQLTILLCFFSITGFAQTQIDSGQIRRIPIAKLVTPTTPTNGQVIKYNSSTGKWESGTDETASTVSTRIVNYNQNATFDSRFLVYASGIVITTGTASHGTDISWQFLTSSTDHDFIFFNSATGLANQRLEIGYPRVKRVLTTHVTPDETFTANSVFCGPTVDLTKMEINAYRNTSQVGIRLTGSGSGAWTKNGNDASLFTVSNYSTGSGLNITGEGDYNKISLMYMGPNNYGIRQLYSGLGPYNMGFVLVDRATGLDVSTAPTTSDEVIVQASVLKKEQVNLKSWSNTGQFSDNVFMEGGTCNFWISALFEAWMVASPISTTSIQVRWQPSWPSATNYKIYRDVNSDFSTQTLIHTGTSGSYTDTGLTTNTLYYYKLVATVGSDVTVTTFATRTE